MSTHESRDIDRIEAAFIEKSTRPMDIKRARLAVDTIEGYGFLKPGQDGYGGLIALRGFIDKVEQDIVKKDSSLLKAAKLVVERHDKGTISFAGDSVSIERLRDAIRYVEDKSQE